MTVTVDAATENVRTGTTSPQTFSHAGAASGVKGVVLALAHGTSSTDHVSAASYGGVALARIYTEIDDATEPGRVDLWFLGAGVPQGTQTVSYTPGATTDDFHAVAITLLGADDLEVVDQDGLFGNTADPSVTLQYAGRTCMAFAVLYGGGAAPSSFTPNANCVTVHDHDLGAFYSEVIRQTTAGNADFAIGGTASSDDVAYAAIAVSEVIAGGAFEINAESGAYTVTGFSTLSVADRMLNGQPGSYALAGVAASIVVDRALNVEPGSYVLSGIAAGLTSDRVLDAAPGSYSLTGVAAGLLADRVLNAISGSYVLSGVAAELVYAAGAAAFVINAESGSYVIVGADAQLLADRVLNAEPGGYTITGLAASLVAERMLNAAVGSYTLDGFAASLVADRTMNAEVGVYTIVGSAAELIAIIEHVLNAAPGSYTIVGFNARGLLEFDEFPAGEGVGGSPRIHDMRRILL